MTDIATCNLKWLFLPKAFIATVFRQSRKALQRASANFRDKPDADQWDAKW
jgi:hypothetical protein